MAQLAEKLTISTESTELIPVQSDKAEIPYSANIDLSGFYKRLENEQEIQDSTGDSIKEQFQSSDKVVVRLFRQEQKHHIVCSFVTQKWEGIIKEVYDNSFLAQLYKKDGDEQEIIEGEFDFDDVPKDDRILISPGVFFYWVLGREITKGGQISNVASVRIRRMPTWNRFNIDKTNPKVEDFTSFFADDESK